MAILDVKNLDITYNGKRGKHHIVKDISFSIEQGQCLCILGESGSGKSITMKATMGLLDKNFEISGSAILEDLNLLSQDAESLREIRGSKLTMILQNPMTCFDTLYRVGYQMKETFLAHTNWTEKEIHQKSVEALEKMQINNAEEVLRKYPHQLSGGMLQRIMIAIAITLSPQVLIADEPTTAIDAITQFEIMSEFMKLKNNKTTMVFITHDIGIASLIADQVVVMNGGRIVDQGTFSEIMENPKDEYTRLLIEKRMAVMHAYEKILAGDMV